MDTEQFEHEYVHTPAHELAKIENLADILARLDHSWFNDTAGSSGDPGPFCCYWYGCFSDNTKGFHAIVSEDNNGFHYCEIYENADECAKAWRDIQKDAMQNALDESDFEYFGCSDESELRDMIAKL
jgi:hypothetical protein